MKYIVICFSVHERRVASYDPFETEKDACKFLETDARNTYEEEYENSDEEGREKIELDLGEREATLSSCDGEFVWTWEILFLNSD